MNNAAYGEAMENLGSRINVKVVSNKKRLFKMSIQTKLYITRNICPWFSCDT